MTLFVPKLESFALSEGWFVILYFDLVPNNAYLSLASSFVTSSAPLHALSWLILFSIMPWTTLFWLGLGEMDFFTLCLYATWYSQRNLHLRCYVLGMYLHYPSQLELQIYWCRELVEDLLIWFF